ncbi:PAP2-domain-containing protein [Anaeromyces robustus]|uniref:PAP2-domain-containing protein n=1 Tax=Anaeromyces robustus TaxID=1754192 RepID=A0A1Y1WP41_9FUNG|nr:PAP2-domain-containing protein [Anaeromyces robustus]|eukprot:ORX75309.1 PAP2-domain-containing protein [Anaeromyces robustus]
MQYLVSITLIVCFLIITGFKIVKKRSKFDYNQALIGLVFSFCISSLFVNVIKNLVGRYRPDFISICDIDFNKVNEQYEYYSNITTDINYGPRNLFNTSICQNTNERKLNEGRRSFPSGHSSLIFSEMTYISLYMAGQLHLLNKKTSLWKLFVVLIPYTIAIAVALSRVFDYRHHWEDVTVGGFIGFIFGIIVYFFYFPSLTNENCDIAYQRDSNKNNKKVFEDLEMIM